MSLTREDVEKIAHLARIQLQDDDITEYTQSLSDILQLIEQMQQIEATGITPMAHPLDATARLRADAVTEPNLREHFQGIAPQVEVGLYLVPKVIE